MTAVITGIIAGGSALATALITPLLISIIARAIAKTRPQDLTGESGAISPDKSTATITVSLGLLVVFGGIAGCLLGYFLWPIAVILALIGLPIAGFMAPSLTHVHDVFWSEAGVEGPSSLFGPTLGLSRTLISWGDIVRRGETSTQYWFVESRDGRRVYWSYLYRGHMVLADKLKQNVPALRAS